MVPMTAPSAAPRVLTVVHEEHGPAGTWGRWLEAAGVRLHELRPATGEPVPADLTGFAGLLVLGGSMGPCDDDVCPWLPATRALIRRALADGVPNLNICLGAELAAAALDGGAVGRMPAPELGAVRLWTLPAAAEDPVLAETPADALGYQWHQEQVLRLPDGSVPLVAGEDCRHQAWRTGRTSWSLQFHPEITAQIARWWAEEDPQWVSRLGAGASPATVADAVAHHLPAMERAWRPAARRWARLVHEHAARG